MKKKLQFVTRFHENRIISLSGKQFFSKRLNGQEEMELQRVQLIAMNASPEEIINLEIDYYLELLNFRAVNNSNVVDRDFVLDNMSKVTGIKLLNYLRTGEGLNPAETLDLPVFEGFDIDDRSFSARCLSYREALYAGDEAAKAEAGRVKAEGERILAEAERLDALQAHLLGSAEYAAEGSPPPEMTPEEYQDALAEAVKVGLRVHEEARIISQITADVVATYLNARLVAGEEISGAWLLERITETDIAQIIYFLTSGEVSDAEEGAGEGAGEGAEAVDSPNVLLPVTGGVNA